MAAGKAKKIKRGVMCIIYSEPEGSEEKQFLILHRVLNWRGWEFVKGGIDALGKGEVETTEEAGMREIKEEAGLECVEFVKALKGKHEWHAEGVDYDYDILLFRADIDEEVKLQTSPVKEHDKFEWVPQRDVRAKLHYENTKKIFDSVLGEI